MLVKTVDTIVATNSAGKQVDALPVYFPAGASDTGADGKPATIVHMVEDPNGIPIRVVAGKTAQNSAGKWIDSTFGEGAIWYDTAAVLDADFLRSRFRFDGATYTTEAAFLAAIGGVKASNQRVIGPYVDPAATELILNGGFPTDFTSWTQLVSTGASLAVVAATARFTGSTNTDGGGAGGAGISQGFATVLNRGYVATYDILLGTTNVRIGSATVGGAGPIGGSRSAATGYRNGWSARQATSYFYAFRNTAGTTGIDNVSVKEGAPFKGFTHGGFTARIRGTTPAAASGTKVAASFDIYDSGIATTPDALELVYNSAGELHVQSTNNGSMGNGDINLGTVAVNTAFDVVLSCKTGEVLRACLNGGIPLNGGGGGIAVSGFVALYIGRHNQTGNLWDGPDPRVQVWAGGGVEQFYGVIDRTIHAEGDSFMAGSGGVVLPTTLQAAMVRPVYNTGLGGATATDIRDRLVALSALAKNRVTVIWDGSENPITTLAEVPAYVELIATGLAALGHGRFVIIPACANSGDDMVVVNAIADAMRARWPNNFLDWRGFLTLNGAGGYPSDDMFVALPGDTTHLSQSAMTRAASALASFINGKGW